MGERSIDADGEPPGEALGAPAGEAPGVGVNETRGGVEPGGVAFDPDGPVAGAGRIIDGGGMTDVPETLGVLLRYTSGRGCVVGCVDGHDDSALPAGLAAAGLAAAGPVGVIATRGLRTGEPFTTWIGAADLDWADVRLAL